MKFIVMLIGHKMNSGKDLLANLIGHELQNYPGFENGFLEGKIKIVHFADKLKEICRTLYSLSSYQVVSHEGKSIVDPRFNKTPRQILQDVGQMHRSICPNVWINYIINEHMSSKNSGTRVLLIPDFRFKNEHTVLRDYVLALGNGLVTTVKITRDSSYQSSDISEIDLDKFDFDFEIENNKDDLEDLRQQAEYLAQWIVYKLED